MKKFLKYFTFLLLAVIVLAVAGVIYIKTALPNVGPAPELHVKLTPENIKRGEYLVTAVAGCVDCHSPRDWSRISGPKFTDSIGAGGMKFGHEFGLPGSYYSPNITPAGIGNYTDGELFRAITTGQTKTNQPLFPIMPYPNFGTMDKEDIYAIIAYIRTLKPIEHHTPPADRDFPVSLLVYTMPQKAAFTTRPSENDSVAYGRYLVAFAGCADCHSPTDDKGAPLPGMDFAGGKEFHMPTGGVVRPANITPDKETGIGSWSKTQFFEAIRKYKDKPLGPVETNTFATVMPYATFSMMTDHDLSAVYAYLRTLKPVKNNVVKFTPDQQAL
jgi:mono/diheme cytochrome c family protein